MIRKILTFPNPILTTKSQIVPVIDAKIKQLIQDLFETMYARDDACGLAAVQIGELKRITVIDVSKERNQPICLINPTIIAANGTYFGLEGCLSFPGVFEKVTRANEITYTAMNELGETYTKTCDGFLSECIQHEIDHLNGIVFTEKMSALRRKRALNNLKKLAKANA